MGCIYEITCTSCKEPVAQDHEGKETRDSWGQGRYNYIGMTMSLLHSRMEDHKKQQRSKASNSVEA